LKKLITKEKASGMAKDVGLEFKPQSASKKKKYLIQGLGTLKIVENLKE
jgi:hypothetical protein